MLNCLRDNECRIEMAVCLECCTEALEKEYETNRPDWIIRYEDGDFGITDSEEATEWRKNHTKEQRCLVIYSADGYGEFEVFTLCGKHLRELAEQVELLKSSLC